MSNPEVLGSGQVPSNAVVALQELQQNPEAIRIQGWHQEAIDGPDGVYMANILPEAALEVTISNIQEVTGPQLGSADSHHEVRFARVSLLNADGETAEADVAVKHFDDASENAIFELKSLIAVGDKGIDVLIPAAIVKDGSDMYLMTFYRPEINSMDNQKWDARPGESGYETVCENLEYIADIMAMLHANGVFHGDAQPKNFTRNDVGKSVVIDLEMGCHIAETGSEDHINAFNRIGSHTEGSASNDIRQLWMTINRPMGQSESNPDNCLLGSNCTPQELLDTFETSFIDRYIATLEALSSPETFSSLRTEEVIERIREKMQQDLGIRKHNS